MNAEKILEVLMTVFAVILSTGVVLFFGTACIAFGCELWMKAPGAWAYLAFAPWGVLFALLGLLICGGLLGLIDSVKRRKP